MLGRILTRRTIVGVGAALVVIAAAVLLRMSLDPAREPRRHGAMGNNEPCSAPALAEATWAPEAEASSQAGAPAEQAELPLSKPPFANENDYLRTLERLNVSDKRQALELVRRGDEWYSDKGVKAEARKALGISLLVDLGQMEEARALTRRFIAEHPTSVYRPLVQGVTGIHPRPSGPGG